MRFFAIMIGSGGMESALAICVSLSFCRFEMLELSSHLYVTKVAISYIQNNPKNKGSCSYLGFSRVGSSLRLKGTKIT